MDQNWPIHHWHTIIYLTANNITAKLSNQFQQTQFPTFHWTFKGMVSLVSNKIFTQVVKMPVTIINNSPFQDYPHQDNHTIQKTFYYHWYEGYSLLTFISPGSLLCRGLVYPHFIIYDSMDLKLSACRKKYREIKSRCIKMQNNRTRPISSHLDWKSLVNKGFIIMAKTLHQRILLLQDQSRQSRAGKIDPSCPLG